MVSRIDGRAILLEDGVLLTIGRAADVDVHLPDQSVSRKHCTVERAQGQIRMIDLESANGTFINERAITAGVLQPGDSAARRLGRLRLPRASRVRRAGAGRRAGRR